MNKMSIVGRKAKMLTLAKKAKVSIVGKKLKVVNSWEERQKRQ